MRFVFCLWFIVTVLHESSFRLRPVGGHASTLQRNWLILSKGWHPPNCRPSRSELVAGAKGGGRKSRITRTGTLPGIGRAQKSLCAAGSRLCSQDQHLRYQDIEEKKEEDVSIQVERWIRRCRATSLRRSRPNAAIPTQDSSSGRATWCRSTNSKKQVDQQRSREIWHHRTL